MAEPPVEKSPTLTAIPDDDAGLHVAEPPVEKSPTLTAIPDDDAGLQVGVGKRSVDDQNGERDKVTNIIVEMFNNE